MRKIIGALTLLILFIALNAIASNQKASVDHSIYAELLGKHVKNGVVSYKNFKNDEARLDEYLKTLENTNPDKLDRNEKFAFYINAYNAWTIKLILTGYPGVKSIKDMGSIFQSPWKKGICRLNGKIMTLDDIEHGILRPEFKDPRVHFAINCASKDCPPLIPEPYYGAILDKQLDESAKAFINDPAKNRLKDNTLYISSIFKWFSEDFKDDPRDFILKHASGELKAGLEKAGDSLKIEYLDYDWSLNGN
ncbi:DUF547 domain-containing protein [Desulforegula conservatrix]|uniref:DUF547 domain-containing protein n=1 Tax=Desulforegula conservatrix TaxID=153026 RepID=UPI000429C3FC|nr:DUF547 domain-containing protein [Desulforegula conservatrix]